MLLNFKNVYDKYVKFFLCRNRGNDPLKNVQLACKFKTLRLYVYVLGLLLDYLFPSYPQAFDLYPNNAGYLSEPLFKSPVLDYSRLTYSTQLCRAD